MDTKRSVMLSRWWACVVVCLVGFLGVVGCSDDSSAEGDRDLSGTTQDTGGSSGSDTSGTSGTSGADSTSSTDTSGTSGTLEDTSTSSGADVLPDADVTPPDPNAIQITFDPAGEGFFRTPWPSDARLTATGTPDLHDFPDVNAQPLLGAYRAEIERAVHGFATMAVVYIQIDRPLAATTFPSILESTQADSKIQLIDLSEAGCGQRVPLEIAFNANGDRFTEDNLIQAAVAVGHVLKPATPYGLVVLRNLGDDEGFFTDRPALFDALLGSASSTPEGQSLAPFNRCLPQTGLALDDVAFATVFTTQDPLYETRLLRDTILDPVVAEVRALKDWRRSEAWSRAGDLITYEAAFEAPIFQSGQTPYETEGGELIFDAEGRPAIQRWEDVPMAVSWIDDPTKPTVRPVLVFIDGTGWSPWNHLTDNWVRAALDEGYVVASFMPQFHGGRAGFSGDTDVSTFNFFNPPAARTNFRQQCAETSYFLRVIRDQIAEQPEIPTLNLDHIVYGGHSQGAIVGAMNAGVEDQFDSYVLNGLSAYLTLTIIDRKDLADYEALIQSAFRITRELDRFYPLLQVVQLGAEAVDSHNYVQSWKGWPGNPDGNHVFVINGFKDATTTPRGIDQLTITADLAPIDPPGWDVDVDGTWDRAPEPLPISGNRDTTDPTQQATLATLLDLDTGHFTVYQRRAARDLALRFWDSSASTTEPPILEMLRESFCTDQRDDDGDTLVDCDDPDCAGFGNCVETACRDNADNDNDGFLDCADPDCINTNICNENNCDDDADNDGDSDTDCDDATCVGSQACEERICNDGFDTDDDNLIDCRDPACMRTDTCPLPREASCNDSTDDDTDSLTDCDDPDCVTSTDCPNTTCAEGDLGSATGSRLLSVLIEDMPDRFPPASCVPINDGLGGHDVVVAWTAPETARYAISSQGTRFDTVLSLFPTNCDFSTPIACNDDGLNFRLSRIERDFTAGEQVVIVLSAYDASATGPAVLSIEPLP